MNFVHTFSFLAAVLLTIINSIDAVDAELKGLKFLINFISGEFMETKRDEAVSDEASTYMPSKGQTNYTFIDFITHTDQMQCLPYDHHNEPEHPESTKKGPIKVRCLPNRGNGSLQIVNSLKEVVTLLAPHGNSSKRTDEGNCALVLFYSKTCIHSAAVAHHFNAVSTFFPDIRMGAIDALRFHGLNTDFGIVGLPTIMLFHQGRPVVKFNHTLPHYTKYASFVEKHTGIKTNNPDLVVTSKAFLSPLSNVVEEEVDVCLYLAWSFIMLCSCYYFTKSKLYISMVVAIKRNWRESGAHNTH